MGKELSTQFKDVNINLLLSFIAEGLVIFNREGYITMLNPHASLLLDYTTDELIGQKLDKIIPMYLGDKHLDGEGCITACVLRGEIFTVPSSETLYFESHSNRRFPVFASAKPMWSSRDEGEVEGGVLVFRDVTVEKELEQYKENTAKTLSKLTPILQKTATGDFTFYPELPKEENEFTELLVGLRLMLDDLRELDLARQKNEQEKISALEEKRALTEKYSKELEQEVDRKTNELKNAKRHIETIIENLTTGLVEYDSKCRIVRLNKAAEDMLGVKKSDVIGKEITREDRGNESLTSIVLVTHPDLSRRVKEVSHDVSGVDANVYELSISHPIERDLQVAEVPIFVEGADDDSAGMLKVIRDVTREKLISRSKSEFISIAAHQLRTPLSAVKWSLNLLQSGDFGKLDEEQSRVVSEAFDTNEKMISLVNDLLNVARIEDGRFGYEFKESDFRDLISKMASASALHSKEKDIELIFHDKSQEELKFIFDENKISVAIQNLIDNAIKYTPKGGVVEVTLTSEDKFVHVEVKDTGVGIPKKQINRLFTKFFRAENVVRLPVSGSGLGLFITRNIIIRHGGDITVNSKEGEGTTFHFTIPTDEALIPAKDDVAASLYTQ